MITTLQWDENRKAIEEHVADVYPTSRDQDRGADWWTASDHEMRDPLTPTHSTPPRKSTR